MDAPGRQHLPDDEGDEGDVHESMIAPAGSPSPADERVAELLEAGAEAEQLAPAVEQQEAPDAAETLESLTPEQSVAVVQRMEEESAAEALAHMDHALAATVLADLDAAESAALLQEMAPDDAVDILQALPRAEAERALLAMPAPAAATLGKLARYDPRSAGGMMTTVFPSLPAGLTVAGAVDFLRSDPAFTDDPSPSSTLYCTDEQRRLVGTIDLRQLLVSHAQRHVADIMRREVDAIGPHMDREDVAREFQKYDYIALPVIDDERRVLGEVTIDDVIDIIQAEQTEDAQRQVGAGARESVASPLAHKIAGRLPWLLLNLLTSQVAAVTVLGFRDTLKHVEILAALMGVIANQAGNAGQQSLAVTLRGLVLGDVRPGRRTTVVVKEVGVGLLSGVAVGALLMVLAAVIGALGWIDEMNWRLGVVGGVSMAAALTVGCLVGSAIPILMDRFGRDPATGSTIFLTMVTDSSSFLTFLGLASALMGWVTDKPAV